MSSSLLTAHLVFVTKCRRKVFTDAMLTFTEHTMHGVCTDLGAELVEFNGEADQVHLSVDYPRTLAISVLAQRLKGRTAYEVRRELTGACVRARIRGHLWSQSNPAVCCEGAPLVDHQAIHRRASPTTVTAGLRPATNGMG